jgi:NAD(P)-dependent dehydrogenase (short-subunit alcohol dehydrogenase family)
MPPLRLDSKRALVTGSAKGLGAAIKRSLATAGAKVLQTCRTLY